MARLLARAQQGAGAVARILLVFLLATCHVDQLTNTPPPIATLAVVPRALRDSAAVGSTATPAESIAVVNAGQGTLSWHAELRLGGEWLTVSASDGVAPATLHLSFNPAGLATGLYRDTLVVTGANADSSPARVPIEFAVHPCTAVPLVPDVVLHDSLTTRDCAAPHRSTSFARVYTFTGHAGDSISVLMTSTAVDGYVMLDSSLAGAAPALAQNGGCGTGCIRYQRLPASGTYEIEAAAGPGQTGAFTLSVTRPRPPAVPTGLAQLRTDSITALPVGGTTDQAVVVLRGTLSDPDAGDSLRLEVEAQPVGTPFTGVAGDSSARVANGASALVAVSGLANN